MVICVSVDDKKSVDKRFGRCDEFAIYDSVSKETSYVENIGKSQSNGAGIKAAKQVIDLKADVLISGKIGPNAFEVLEGAGIKVLKADSANLQSVIDSAVTKNLEVLSDASGKSHGGMS